MWEAQERYTYAETFFKPLFAHLVSTLRNYSNQTMSNLLRSIGTLCYRDSSVDLVLEDAQRRAYLCKDLQMIQTMVATAVNLGSNSFKDDASMKMLEVFAQEYLDKQDKDPKATTKGHAEYEKGQRYLQLVTLSRTLAKVENYENPIFALLFKELKHIILFNQLTQRS
jgi:hypothetical protein